MGSSDETIAPSDLPKDPTLTYDPARLRRERASADTIATAALPLLGDTESETIAGASSETPALLGTPEGPNFVLHARIGRGGMGEVWEASQGTLLRTIAVKTIRADLLSRLLTAEDKRAIQRDFVQEAITTAGLEHPNIVPVYDLGRDPSGEPMLAMKLVRGKNWEETLSDDFLQLSAADFVSKHLLILIAVAQAVAFAHSRGIVHRDLKPSQVMIGDFGEVLLMDWGLALVYDTDLSRQRIPQLVDSGRIPTRETASSPSGTPAYMAPEQTERTPHNIGPWTDVFLLGGTLYRVLTGVTPYAGTRASEVFENAAACRFPPPLERAPDREIPVELAALTMSAMAKLPANRISSAMAFVDALKDYLTGAGKRRESEVLAAKAAESLAEAGGSYGILNEAANALDQSFGLWPQNPRIGPLRAEVFTAYARAAIGNGDLTLAKVQAERLAEGDVRRQLLKEVEDRSLSLKRDAKQRRMFQVATAVLVAVVAISFLVMRDIRTKAEESKLRAEIFRDLNTLRQSEIDLVEELKSAVPRPIDVMNRNDAFDEVKRQREGIDARAVARMIARRGSLRSERARLERLVPEGIPTEPIELSLAEANYLLVTDADSSSSLSQAMALYQRAQRANPADADPLVGLASVEALSRHYEEAARFLADAAALTLKKLGPRHPEYANVLRLQGRIALTLIDSSERSSGYYYEALSILEPQFQQQSLAIAEMYRQVNNNGRALEYTSVSLALAKRLYGNADQRTGVAISTQGTVLLGLNRPAEAERYLKEVLELDDKLYGPDHRESITSLANLASLNRMLGHFDEADRQTSEALVRARRVKPPDPGVISKLLLSNARDRYERRMFTEALSLMPEPLKVIKDAFGDHGTSYFEAELVKVRILYRAEKLEEAIELANDSLKRMRGSIGIAHPIALEMQGFLADMLVRVGHVEESDKVVQEVLSILKDRGFRDGDGLIDALAQVVVSLNARREFQRTRDLMTEVLPAAIKTYGEDGGEVGTIYHYLALAGGQLGDFEEMLKWSLKSARVREKMYGPNSEIVAGTYYNIAIAYGRTGRREEAIPYLRKSLKNFVVGQGPGADDTMACLRTLAEYLEATGDRKAALTECDLAIARIRSAPDVRILGLSSALGLKAELLSRDGQDSAAFDGAREGAQVLLDAGGVVEALTSDSAAMMATLYLKAGRTKEAATMRVVALAATMKSSRMAPLMKPYRALLPQESLMAAGDAASVLRAMRLAEDVIARPIRYNFGVTSDADDRLVRGYDRATSAALALAPPNQSLARHLARRAVAVLAVQGIDREGNYGRWITKELPASLGITADADRILATSSVMKDPAPLGPDFLLLLDAVEPAIEWEEEAPEVKEWGIDSLLSTYPGALEEAKRLIHEGRLE